VGAAGGEAAALVTGLGQPDLTRLDDLGPYVLAQDLVLAGLHEPGDETVAEVRQALPLALEVTQMRDSGMEQAAASVLECYGADVDGVWVHVDADVLDPSVMPAVDSPEPGGLLPDEFVEFVAALVRSGRVAGMDVAIYDPDRDPDGRAGDVLADAVVRSLAPLA
jgi:arginase